MKIMCDQFLFASTVYYRINIKYLLTWCLVFVFRLWQVHNEKTFFQDYQANSYGWIRFGSFKLRRFTPKDYIIDKNKFQMTNIIHKTIWMIYIHNFLCPLQIKSLMALTLIFSQSSLFRSMLQIFNISKLYISI